MVFDRKKLENLIWKKPFPAKPTNLRQTLLQHVRLRWRRRRGGQISTISFFSLISIEKKNLQKNNAFFNDERQKFNVDGVNARRWLVEARPMAWAGTHQVVTRKIFIDDNSKRFCAISLKLTNFGKKLDIYRKLRKFQTSLRSNLSKLGCFLDINFH